MPREQNPRELVVLGRRVRRLRQARDLSQQGLGDRAGIHRTYVGGVERGERNLGILNLHAFARALDMSVEEFLTGL